MNKLTVGVVGLGSIARKAHLPVLAVHPQVEIIGLASRTGAQVEALAAQYRLNLVARTFQEILAVKPQAIALLNAGIAVYMEKPLANDLQSAQSILTAAAGRTLMVGFNRRYAPAYRRAKELFAGRPPELVQITKHRNEPHPEWDSRRIVMDDAIHIIDLARFFGGDLKLQASHSRRGLTVAQCSVGDTQVQLSQSYGAGAPTERVELHGGGLTVIIEEMERLTVRENGKERVEQLFGSWTLTLEKKGMAGATEHFLTCLRTGAQPETSAAEAYKTQELAEGILSGGAG